MTDASAVEAVELLPCPVCGEQPRWRGTRSDYARGIYRLQCLRETHLFQAYGPDEERTITAWNARAAVRAPSDQEKLVAELVEALEFYGDETAWNQPPVKTCEHELLGPGYENQASKVRLDRGRIARAALTRAREIGEQG